MVSASLAGKTYVFSLLETDHHQWSWVIVVSFYFIFLILENELCTEHPVVVMLGKHIVFWCPKLYVTMWNGHYFIILQIWQHLCSYLTFRCYSLMISITRYFTEYCIFSEPAIQTIASCYCTFRDACQLVQKEPILSISLRCSSYAFLKQSWNDQSLIFV